MWPLDSVPDSVSFLAGSLPVCDPSVGSFLDEVNSELVVEDFFSSCRDEL